MFKKIVLASAIYVGCANMSFAGTPYVGGSLGWSLSPESSGPIGTAFGGYGVRLEQNKRIYLGGELNATAGYYTRYIMSYSFGASFIPGVMITDNTMLYTRLGISTGFTHYHYSDSNWSEKHNSRLKTNGLYGLGLQTSLDERWDLRGEYTATTSYKTGEYSVGLVYKFN